MRIREFKIYTCALWYIDNDSPRWYNDNSMSFARDTISDLNLEADIAKIGFGLINIKGLSVLSTYNIMQKYDIVPVTIKPYISKDCVANGPIHFFAIGDTQKAIHFLESLEKLSREIDDKVDEIAKQAQKQLESAQKQEANSEKQN